MSLQKRDRDFVWHPFTQEKTSPYPIPIVRAEAEFLFTEDGKRLIDAISSWWVNLHGHANPYISEKISAQLGKLHQVIFAGFTHEPAVSLAESLLKILPGPFSKVFYSDDGSTAVEVAIKMAIQFWYNQRERPLKRAKLLALEGGYHGDTFGAMSVGARSAFSAPFEDFLFEVVRIPLPKSAADVDSTLSQIESVLDQVAAIIYEPLVQGAAGMVIYPSEHLERLLTFLKAHKIILIADEVMTGFGRTGTLFASEQLTTRPDIICLSKGLTGGSLALGVSACTEEIYQAFYSSDRLKTFFHGHSYTANALSCSAAIASLELLLKPGCKEAIARISKRQREFVAEMKRQRGVLCAESIGTIARLELITKEGSGYFNSIRDSLYSEFISAGVLLRPLGNVIYVMPPYCISDDSLEEIYDTIARVLERLRL